jgi:hypothetical protein
MKNGTPKTKTTNTPVRFSMSSKHGGSPSLGKTGTAQCFRDERRRFASGTAPVYKQNETVSHNKMHT